MEEEGVELGVEVSVEKGGADWARLGLQGEVGMG